MCDITSCTQKACILTLDPMAMGKGSPRNLANFDIQLVTPTLGLCILRPQGVVLRSSCEPWDETVMPEEFYKPVPWLSTSLSQDKVHTSYSAY